MKYFQATVEAGTVDFTANIKFLVLADNLEQAKQKTKHLTKANDKYSRYQIVQLLELKEVSNPDCFDLDITL